MPRCGTLRHRGACGDCKDDDGDGSMADGVHATTLASAGTDGIVLSSAIGGIHALLG
jgi:hypothetical protein